jgi:hypothetical protein
MFIIFIRRNEKKKRFLFDFKYLLYKSEENQLKCIQLQNIKGKGEEYKAKEEIWSKWLCKNNNNTLIPTTTCRVDCGRQQKVQLLHHTISFFSFSFFFNNLFDVRMKRKEEQNIFDQLKVIIFNKPEVKKKEFIYIV